MKNMGFSNRLNEVEVTATLSLLSALALTLLARDALKVCPQALNNFESGVISLALEPA